MNTAKLILIILSNQGYWFGGQSGSIDLRWAMQAPPTEAVLEWNLTTGGVRLAGDRVAMPTGDRPSRVHITLPEMRVRTALQWQYRLLSSADGREIERGERTVHVYPSSLLEKVPKLLDGTTLLVLDSRGELSGVLEQAHVAHERVKAMQDLQFTRAELIMIGPDELTADAIEQAPIVDLARAGRAVCLLPQSKAASLAGYALADRALPKQFDWRPAHPLLTGLSANDLRSWFSNRRDARAIRLPVDEPALEIGWWPREDGGTEPVPIDAVLAVKAIGQGRLVLCQLPLGSFKSDPRTQQLLANLIGYLTTRPEPTPPPSLRQAPLQPTTAPVPTITIPSGGAP